MLASVTDLNSRGLSVSSSKRAWEHNLTTIGFSFFFFFFFFFVVFSFSLYISLSLPYLSSLLFLSLLLHLSMSSPFFLVFLSFFLLFASFFLSCLLSLIHLFFGSFILFVAFVFCSYIFIISLISVQEVAHHIIVVFADLVLLWLSGCQRHLWSAMSCER